MEVRSVEAIVCALNTAEVAYLIVGGLAVNAHGYERLTQVVDLVTRLAPHNIVRPLRALGEIGYRMPIPVTQNSLPMRLIERLGRRRKHDRAKTLERFASTNAG